LHKLKPIAVYEVTVDENPVKNIKSNLKGELVINHNPTSAAERLTERRRIK
jgi:hypothetical protein